MSERNSWAAMLSPPVKAEKFDAFERLRRLAVALRGGCPLPADLAAWLERAALSCLAQHEAGEESSLDRALGLTRPRPKANTLDGRNEAIKAIGRRMSGSAWEQAEGLAAVIHGTERMPTPELQAAIEELRATYSRIPGQRQLYNILTTTRREIGN